MTDRESRPDAIYEAWAPVEGQRVRVRLSGECRTEVAYFTDDDNGEITHVGHEGSEDGAVGTILVVDGTADHPMWRNEDLAWRAWLAHRVLVEYDEAIVPATVTRYPQTCEYFAVAELELIDERDD